MGNHRRLGATIPAIMYVLIVASLITISLETMDSVRQAVPGLFSVLEAAFLTIFAVEFAARLYAAPDRLDYLTSTWGIIDFLAAIPPLLLLAPDMQSVRALRLLRLFRLVRLMRVRGAYRRLRAALSASREELALFGFFTAIMLYLAAVGIYYFEHPAQPEVFSSIPESLWWATATLTTVGYGDIFPVTAGGRIFTAFLLLIGLGIVAVPAGILSSALLEGRRRDQTGPKKKREGG